MRFSTILGPALIGMALVACSGGGDAPEASNSSNSAVVVGCQSMRVSQLTNRFSDGPPDESGTIVTFEDRNGATVSIVSYAIERGFRVNDIATICPGEGAPGCTATFWDATDERTGATLSGSGQDLCDEASQ